MPRLLTTLLALSLLSLSTAWADGPFVWKWEEGETKNYKMTQTMSNSVQAGPAGNIESGTTQVITMTWSAEEVSEDGTAKIAQQMDQITMQSTGPMAFSYDSSSEEAPTGGATLVAPMFDAMTSAPIQVTMLETGEYSEVELSDKMAEAFKNIPGGAASPDMIKQLIEQGSPKFPAKELEVGESWTQTTNVNAPPLGQISINATYTYEGTEEIDDLQIAKFSIAMKMEIPKTEGQPMQISMGKQESSGELLFDIEDGCIHQSTIDQSMAMLITVGPQTVNSQIKNTTRLEQVEATEQPQTSSDSEAPVGAATE